jgi:hypothetical protein
MTMTTTTTRPVTAGPSAPGSDGSQKDFFDFLGGILPDAAQAAAPSLGIDPRVAGQTVSQVLSIFGIGGPGKAFTATIPKEQAVSQLQQLLTPYLSDPASRALLGRWMQAALEPVQAQKEGKDYRPSVDWSKSWLDDAFDTIGDVITSDSAQTLFRAAMDALPYAVALL